MKKLVFACLLFTISFASFSQENELEKKIGIRDIPFETLAQQITPVSNLNCKCNKNELQDGGFTTVVNYPSSSNISPSSPIWKPGDYTPQSTQAMGACDKGYVSMWGNKVVGESIYQAGLNLVVGKCYTLKYNARFYPANAAFPYVQLAVKGANSPGSPRPGGTIDPTHISSTSWASYSMTFTATNTSIIYLYPVNESTVNSGNNVSWIQLDNICIEECCDCSKLPSQFSISGTS